MPTIHTLHKSITEMDRVNVFNLIEEIKVRRKVPTKTVEQKEKIAKVKKPKTSDPLTLAKSLNADEKEKLKQALLSLMNS